VPVGDAKSISYSCFGVEYSPNVVIKFEVTIKEKARYVQSEKDIQDGEEVLALVNSHNPNKDQDVGGEAYYDNGVATADINGSVEDGNYIKSSGKTLERGNIANHEIGHLFGLPDRYKFKDFVLVYGDKNNLMGGVNNHTFNLTEKDYSAIVTNAILTTHDFAIQKQYNVKSDVMSYKLSPKNGGTLFPNYNKSVGDRLFHPLLETDHKD
jgi:hypothetical protein